MKIYSLVLVLLLSACTSSIRPAQYKDASDLCETNSGLKVIINHTDSNRFEIHCNNGATFYRVYN